MRIEVLNAAWAQRKWCDGHLFMSIIFVLCIPQKFDTRRKATQAIGGSSTPSYLLATEYTCHPVLRIRKCHYESESTQCCMIFVDENGCVYQNWGDYKKRNTLPAGVLLAPCNGVYDFDHHHKVMLDDTRISSASSTSSNASQATDTGTGLFGLFSAATSAVFSMWSTPHSGTHHSYARSIDDQSINITNSQARGAFIGLADDEQISSFDELQLGASLFLVTHSVYNYKSATTIIEDTRSQTIKYFRRGLSNNQRNMFDKMYKETLRIKGQSQGKIDIIRSLRRIPDRANDFNDIYKAQVDSRIFRSELRTSSSSTVFGNFRILELRQLLISKYSVLVVSDLENSLMHIYRFLNDEASERILELTQALFDRISVRLQKKTGVYIPFEKFLWDIFNIILTAYGRDMNQTILNIRIEFLEVQITKMYIDMFLRHVYKTEKCEFCRGFFTSVQLTD